MWSTRNIGRRLLSLISRRLGQVPLWARERGTTSRAPLDAVVHHVQLCLQSRLDSPPSDKGRRHGRPRENRLGVFLLQLRHHSMAPVEALENHNLGTSSLAINGPDRKPSDAKKLVHPVINNALDPTLNPSVHPKPCTTGAEVCTRALSMT